MNGVPPGFAFFRIDGIHYAVCVNFPPTAPNGTVIPYIQFVNQDQLTDPNRDPFEKVDCINGKVHPLPVMGQVAYRLEGEIPGMPLDGAWETEPGLQRPLDGEVVPLKVKET